MKKLIKVLSLLLIAVLLVPLASACGNNASSRGYDFYIFNTKGENADALQAAVDAYEKQTGLTIKVFSLGSGTDSSETLRADMNSKNKPAIFSVMNIEELAEWKEGGFVLDLNNATEASFKALHDAIPENLRLTTNGTDSYGVPYNVEGYGYIADKKVIGALFGESNVDSFIADFKTASYDEFEAMVFGLDTFIKDGTSTTVTLSGKSYALASEKNDIAKKLNGVFAVAGSEKWTYGDHLINIAIDTVFANPAAAAAATDAQVDTLRNPLIAYAKVLDLKSSHAAGANGPLERGAEYINSTTSNYDAEVQNFADGKAVFVKQGNWVYTNLQKANASVVEQLTFLPIKMPFADSDIKAEGLTADKINSSIPVFVPNYYAINAKVTDEEKKMAQDFLVWLNTSEAGKKFIIEDMAFIPYNADPATTTLPNTLGQSILEYIKSGNTITNAYAGAPRSWSGDTVGLKIMEDYLTKKDWTQKDYEDIADYAIAKWKEMRSK